MLNVASSPLLLLLTQIRPYCKQHPQQASSSVVGLKCNNKNRNERMQPATHETDSSETSSRCESTKAQFGHQGKRRSLHSGPKISHKSRHWNSKRLRPERRGDQIEEHEQQSLQCKATHVLALQKQNVYQQNAELRRESTITHSFAHSHIRVPPRPSTRLQLTPEF